MVREFANSSEDRVSITGRVLSKTQKMILNIQHYKVQIKGKWNNQKKE